MALTKVKLIADGTIVQSHLNASHGITTADIGEGSNLYYTDARARAAVSVSGNALSYNSSTGVITSNYEESPTFTGNVVIDGTTNSGRLFVEQSGADMIDMTRTSVGTYRLAISTSDKFSIYDVGATSDRFVIDSSGFVGIGTTSPSGELHVKSSSGNSDLILERNGYTAWDISAGSTYLSFQQLSGSELMRIDSSGNVGIGTVSPGHKLDVSGNIRLQGGNRKLIYNNGSVETSLDQVSGSTAGLFTLGNLGIGETSLSTKFTVNALATASNNDTPLTVSTIRGGTTGNVRNTELLIQSTRSDTGGNRNIILKSQDVGGTSRNLILDASAVGIGTSSPGEKLDVTGTIRSTANEGKIKINSTATNGKQYEFISIDTGNLGLYDGTAYRLWVAGSGNIGIGTTSPGYKLEVAGTAGINSNLNMSTGAEIRSSDGYGIRLRNAANSANEGGFVRSGLWEGDSSRDPSLFAETGLGLRFYTGGSATERMTINSSGDVDIANTIYTGESLRFNGTGLNATDKKLYSPTDGELQWFTHNLAGAKAFSVSHQGTRQVYLNVSGNSYLNGGNVGIGTTSPSAKLDVQSSGTWGQYGRGSSGDINVENTNTSVTEGGWIGISGYTGNSANGGYYHMAGITAKKSTTAGDGNYGGDLSFWTTAGTGQSGEANSGMYQRMTINRFGNVGIGTTSPLNKFDLRGTAYVTGYTAGFDTSPQGNYAYRLTNDGANSFINLQGGNLGIGTTSPGAKLHVVSTTTPQFKVEYDNSRYVEIHHSAIFNVSGAGQSNNFYIGTRGNNGNNSIVFYTGGTTGTDAGTERVRITQAGEVGIGTTSPSYKLSVNGSFYSNSIATNTYSDANNPPAAYVGIGPAAYNSGGMFRLGQVTSSSSANATNVTVVTTYSSGHWGSQPTFFLEFSVSYYRPSYIKYYCQHEVSGTRMNIIEGPYGGQISSTPLSVTVTQLCASCHGGQPVYKAVWKWSNNGTYLRTSPFITMFGNPASLVYTDGSSSESALDTLFGSSSTPGHGYLLHSINNTQAAGHPRLSTQT